MCSNIVFSFLWALLIFFWFSRALAAPESTLTSGADSAEPTPEELQFFEKENELLRKRYHEENLASFAYNTNVTEANEQKMVAVLAFNAKKNKLLAETIKRAGYEKSRNANIRRQARWLTNLGLEALNEDDYLEVQSAISAMKSHYATTTVCSYTNRTNCKLTLEPDVQERFAHSRDADELAWYWSEWYNKSGTPMRNNYAKYVRLSRKAAQLYGYASYADYWLHFYEDPGFEKQFDNLYHRLLPLYRQIHGYVRYRLRQHYGAELIPAGGNIPMHLLGNMWAQTWTNVIELITPYPEQKFVDLTEEMKRQGYSVHKMFELADEFFKSLGMRALPPSFWNLSMKTRPKDREVVCHASAWDFYQDNDVRVAMCSEVSTKYLSTIHHELGHLQYALQYDKLPAVFRDAANPGFHEAIGDAVTLSVMSAKHLKAIGLSQIGKLDERTRINELFKKAVTKIVFLPFAYTIDKYRFALFRGQIKESDWNCAFWKMRSELGGLEPPIYRSNSDFDPPSKFHITADVEYMRYFTADFLQFQMHKALCRLAGHNSPNKYDPMLDNCDIFGSKEAGKAFKQFLSLGKSQHWKKTLQELTGETDMNPYALLDYFEPLFQWLQKENRRLNVPIGWPETNKIPSDCRAPSILDN
ncbi:angiotensin-converting enzyme-related protein-like [Scaptodrosophila lebanonensis]|uniref:Angiotensin-converting enzyme n=1 Tax=Drosophila lebanonensis TaxID=7225 RepID=A0A6J2U1J7_DROLE|nr:angiotensin-converting enzyme-related protein-like [Scaptodrosophila lebanonensis]